MDVRHPQRERVRSYGLMWISLLVTSLGFAACGGDHSRPAATPTPSTTRSATATKTSTSPPISPTEVPPPSATPNATSTFTATAEPSPTSTYTATPPGTVSLTPTSTFTPTPPLPSPPPTYTSCGALPPTITPIPPQTHFLQQRVSVSAVITGARYLSVENAGNECVIYDQGYPGGGTSKAICDLVPNSVNSINACVGNQSCPAFACSGVDVEQIQLPPPARPENFAYVVNAGSITVGILSIVDLDSGSTVYNLPISYSADLVAIAPNGALAYVTDARGLVWTVDTAGYVVNGSPIPVGAEPAAVAFSPDGAVAYVANAGSGTVSVIDTATAAVTDTIAVGTDPRGVAFAPDGTRAYVAIDGSLVVLDTATGTVLDTISTGADAGPVAVAHDGSAVYVAHPSSESVSIFDTSTHAVSEVSLPSRPADLVVSAGDTTVYVAGNAIYAIDTASKTLRNTIVLPNPVRHIALTPDGAELLVTNAPAEALSKISTATEQLELTIEDGIGASPNGVAAAAAPVPTGPTPSPTATRTPASGVFAYVGSQQAQVVSAINVSTGQIAAVIPTDFQQPIASSPDGRTVYVGGGPTTDVIDTRRNEVGGTFVPRLLTQGSGIRGRGSARRGACARCCAFAFGRFPLRQCVASLGDRRNARK